MPKRKFVPTVGPYDAPITSEIFLRRKKELQACLRHMFGRDEEEPRTREIVSVEQIAARLGLTLPVLKHVIRRGELPAPPKPRSANDDYDRFVERAWRRLSPARRKALQLASEREPEDADGEEGDELSARNTSGVKGVSRLRGKWCAQIFYDGKNRMLGLFDTIEEAADAYLKAAEAKRAGRQVL